MTDDADNGQPRISRDVWRAESAPPPAEPSLISDRRRLLMLLGCIGIVVGALIQPYAVGSEFAGTTTTIGIDKLSDGGYLIVLGLILAVVVLSRGAAESRLRVVQLAPLVLALAALAIWYQLVRQLTIIFGNWLSGGIQPGVWLAGIGAVAAVIGTSMLLVQTWQATPSNRTPGGSTGAVATERVEAGPSTEVIGVMVGGVVGFVLAVGLVSPSLPSGLPLGQLMAILALTLGGAWVGMLVGRRMGLG